MNNELILIIAENCEFYRLNMYQDFIERMPLQHENFKVYGRGYPSYSESKNLKDIIDTELGGNAPYVIFMMNADFAVSDFSGLKSKVYVFTSDSVITNKAHVENVRKHKFKCDGVFYNYLFRNDMLKNTFDSSNVFYWPCWASTKYDYEKYEIEKTIKFFMSGAITGEYNYRKTFRRIFSELSESGMNFVDRFDMAKNEKADNDIYLNMLGKSRYSPHDGGINGRVQGRFFESSFMKSVIIAPDGGEEMRKNGFENGKNCILFPRNKSTTEVKSMLLKIDDFDWKSLSSNAYKLIKERHTTDLRIKAFLDVVLN